MSAGPLPWSVVKGRALEKRARLLNHLISAPAADVPALQIEIKVIDQFVAWFEAGAPQERMIGESNPPPTY